MGEHTEKIVEKTETVETSTPTVPVEQTTVETTEETTTSVPAHEEHREEHRVSGNPENAVTETVTTETTEID